MLQERLGLALRLSPQALGRTKKGEVLNVFVSRPTWVAPDYEAGLVGFLTRLDDMGLNPRTLGATDYPNKAPLDEVIRLLEDCQGCVILGYPQITATAGTVKAAVLEEPLLLPTEWNHIEAGLAYASGLPLLVIHHVGITRGVFDRGAINSYIYEKDLADAGWALQSDITGALQTWRDNVLSEEPGSPGAIPSTDPVCPNCSKGKKRVYMSALPDDFARDFNATHHCTVCGYRTKVEPKW